MRNAVPRPSALASSAAFPSPRTLAISDVPMGAEPLQVSRSSTSGSRGSSCSASSEIRSVECRSGTWRVKLESGIAAVALARLACRSSQYAAQETCRR
jgi:hypothetical protein